MNEIVRNRRSVTSFSAASLPTGTTEIDAAGKSVSPTSSASASAPSGVFVAGFTTTGAPTARAGATLCATRFTGKLNGVIASTGPNGNRRTIPMREPSDSSVSSRNRSPPNRRASSAAHRNVETARATSTAVRLRPRGDRSISILSGRNYT